eukprot:Em0019g348a
MTPVRAAKAELRKVIRNALSSMSPEQKQSETESLVMKFLSSPEYQNSRIISVYVSTPEEVNTWDIVQDIFKSGSRKCFVPRFDGTGMHMLRVHSFEDYNTLPLNKWNISQPESCDGREEGVSAGLDLILVPGLAFTKDGVRLGRGKGYYDSYIARCLEAGLKPHLLSLSFSCQLCENIPVTDRDRNVDRVILP